LIYLGIDPGKSGGLAAIGDNGHVLATAAMPDTPKELYAWIRRWTRQTPTVAATLEKVHAGIFARKAAAGQSMGVSSAFSFGRGVGHIEMALQAADVPYWEVIPRTWQAAMGCITGGDKNVSKGRAVALFPTIKVTHALADALLIAEYGRRRDLRMLE
jgi:hypothetical protein